MGVYGNRFIISRKGIDMCFSAGASFAGGVIISAIGVATVRKVHKPSQVLFSTIPLFFGFQQITEGLLWLLLPYNDYEGLRHVSTYAFLVMAQIIWPVMIPLSVLLMEESEKKKKYLVVLLFTGTTLAIYYAFCLLSYNVYPQIQGFHIFYDNDFPSSPVFTILSFMFYLIATITPLFVSSIKRTHLLGILMTLSCLVTGIFFTQYLLSVWCFFAALISCVIYWILHDSRKLFILGKLKLLKNQAV
jgi:hypothetical protein